MMTLGSSSIRKALAWSLVMGPSVVLWLMVGGIMGALLKATTGLISPSRAERMVLAASVPLSYMSTWGFVSKPKMASQWSTIFLEIRAWRSSVTMMGTESPTNPLTASRRAPSASGTPSATMAPWRERRTPSTPPAPLMPSRSLLTMNSKSPLFIGPEGVAPAAIVGTISAPLSLRTSMKPPISVPVPSRRSSISRPYRGE